MFAYEHILKCLQDTVDLPLTKELFLQQEGQSVKESNNVPLNVFNAIKKHDNGDIQSVLGIPKPVKLDPSQLESLLAGVDSESQPYTRAPRCEDAKASCSTQIE